MRTNAYTCDQCGKLESSENLPSGWRTVGMEGNWSVEEGPVKGDICSAKCAQEWLAAAWTDVPSGWPGS